MLNTLTAKSRCYCLVIILLLVVSSFGDITEQSVFESEFEDDALQSRYLVREMDTVPDWSLPSLEENDFANELKSLLYNQRTKKKDSSLSSQLEMTEDELQLGEFKRSLFSNNRNENFDEYFDSDKANTDSIIRNDMRSLQRDSDFYDEDSDFEDMVRYYELVIDEVQRKKQQNMDKQPPKCSKFVKTPSFRAITSCSKTKTPLGEIQWCKVKCKHGYKIKESTSQFELCGKATKYRWTYELRGLKRAQRKCVIGRAKKDVETCTTPQCFALAAYYMNKINFSVNPCDNFFDFACGRWNQETKIPKSKSHYLTYTVIRDRVNKDVGDLLNNPITSKDPEAVKKAKIFYKSCLNERLINEVDAKPLLNFLQGNMAWPIIDKSWNAESFDFESTLGTLRGKYNNNIMLDIVVGVHDRVNVLEIWKGKMPIPTKYFLDDRYSHRLNSYYSLIYEVARWLGAEKEQAKIDIENMRVFEKKLAFYKKKDFDFFTEKTVEEMIEDIPGVDWLMFLQNTVKSYPVTASTKVLVWCENYLSHLVDLIEETDKRVVQNYMVWTIVRYRIKNLSDRFMKLLLQFENVLIGKQQLDPRPYKCASELIHAMEGPTSKIFIDKYFSKAKKEAAEELFDFVRQGFIQLLDTEVNWMDNKTKSYARRKALAIGRHIGYNPHLYENVTFLNKETEHLKVDVNDYFGNYLRLLEVVSQNKFKKLGKQHDPSKHVFRARATMVNAFYDTEVNTMTLPAGEMQYPFYWGDAYPRMVQFGGIGTILGHELTHGFDNQGRKHGINGELHNWWTKSSLKEFKKRVECIKKQYDEFFWETAGEFIDGTSTLAENIADNGGIRESYAGYQLWLKSQNKTSEDIEPGTGFTNDQMFFIGFANDRCGHFTHEGAVHDVVSNVHSPGRFRVIGSLQNFDKFSKAYNCPSGSYMNPPKKCIVW